MPVFVLRRQVGRQEIDEETGEPREFGGMATLGGMAVLRPEDEAELSYDELGEGHMLFVDGVPDPAEINDAGNGLLTQNSRMCRVESKCSQLEEGWFDTNTGDLIVVDLGLGALMTYEVVSLSSRSHIPPYTRVLIVNPRDDLDYRDGAFPLGDGIAEPMTRQGKRAIKEQAQQDAQDALAAQDDGDSTVDADGADIDPPALDAQPDPANDSKDYGGWGLL